MKRLILPNLWISAVAGVAASILIAGCASKPPAVERIPPTGPPIVGNENPGPPVTVPNPPPISNPGPLPNGGQPVSTGPAPNAGELAANNPSDWPHDTNIFQPFTVYFEFDRWNVKKSEQPKVESVAAFFKDPTHARDHLLIEGHCDERGTEQYNLALGDRRALSLRDNLVALGVPTANIHTVSYGLSRPAVIGHNEAAWSKNRRGVFVLIVPPPGQ